MFIKRYHRELDLQRKARLYRTPPVVEHRKGKYITCGGRELINFASNDYIGLGSSESLRRQVARNFSRYGTSSSSSRLVSSNFHLLNEVEKTFADYFGYEAALFFPSGFQANYGILSTLFSSKDTVFFDKHIHASSVKGLTASGAMICGYKHNQMAHLCKRLQKTDGQAGVVSESLFSMDGDILDFRRFGHLKKGHRFFSIVDEAHAFGVLGPGGKGLAGDTADIAVGTMGKAFGLFGAFVLVPGTVKEYLLNFSSAQIYTTALPEAHAASALSALESVEQRSGPRKVLRQRCVAFKQDLSAAGFKVKGDAHILAVEIGDEQTALDISGFLFCRGIFVLPARYPTVALNKSILRISLTSEHTHSDCRQLLRTLEQACEKKRT